MAAAPTIDWSKYSSAAPPSDGDVDFGKYASAAEPGAVDIPTIQPPPQPPGFWKTLGGDLRPSGFNPYPMMDLDVKQQVAQQAANQAEDRKTAGYSPAYRAIAPVAQGLGLNVPGMEQSAQQGDVSGVLGHAAAPLATMGVAEGIRAGGNIAGNAIPSLDRASQHFQAFESTYGDRPVDLSNSVAKAQKLVGRIKETNLTSVPGPVQALIDRASGGEQPQIMGMDANIFMNRHPEAYQKMLDAGIVQPPQPLTITDARHLRTDLNSVIYDRDVPEQFKGGLKDLAKSVHQDTLGALPTQGAKDWYTSTLNEFSKAQKIQSIADQVGPVVGGAMGYEAGRTVGQPLGGMAVGGMVGKIVGKPVIGGMVRSVLERNVGTVSPPPGAIDSIMQLAKDGQISPGEASRRINNMGVSTKITPPKWLEPDEPIPPIKEQIDKGVPLGQLRNPSYWKSKTYPDTGGQ